MYSTIDQNHRYQNIINNRSTTGFSCFFFNSNINYCCSSWLQSKSMSAADHLHDAKHDTDWTKQKHFICNTFTCSLPYRLCNIVVARKSVPIAVFANVLTQIGFSFAVCVCGIHGCKEYTNIMCCSDSLPPFNNQGVYIVFQSIMKRTFFFAIDVYKYVLDVVLDCVLLAAFAFFYSTFTSSHVHSFRVYQHISQAQIFVYYFTTPLLVFLGNFGHER